MRQLKNFKAEDHSHSADTSKYEGMSEGELISELMKNVSSAKNNGTFSAEQIDDFVRFVSPNLDDASRKRLAELVNMIKGG